MQPIGIDDIRRRIERDNPWWSDSSKPIPEGSHSRRVYFASFKKLALDFSVRRATILLGPRRVGKTFMIKQLIHDAISDGFNPNSILFASIDAPIYAGMMLEKFVSLLPNIDTADPKIIIFDEIQYLKNWEIHLKDLVDTYKNIKFIATGSAAAALRLKSNESGAGRFSEFMLPPLTFFEFLQFRGTHDEVIEARENNIKGRETSYYTKDINALNEQFIDYLNFGGYPEAVLNLSIRDNSDQFIRNDIIDKVLLKDLPSLYGIHSIQELNKLFSYLAYNTGNEANLENISKASGISKPTIGRYIEYLESAFLIMKIGHIDENGRTMARERNFKIYLNNPSMRAALFAPVTAAEPDKIGHLAESAIFSQWQHAQGFRNLRYARWKNEGEIDIVYLEGGMQKPLWIGEIKWSDRIETHVGPQLKNMRHFLEKQKSVSSTFFTTKTYQAILNIDHKIVKVIPSALYCYTIGRNIMSRLDNVGNTFQNSDT